VIWSVVISGVYSFVKPEQDARVDTSRLTEHDDGCFRQSEPRRQRAGPDFTLRLGILREGAGLTQAQVAEKQGFLCKQLLPSNREHVIQRGILCDDWRILLKLAWRNSR
jgi:hypothetical protein